MNPTPASSIAVRMGREVLTLLIVFAADMIAAAILVIVLLPAPITETESLVRSRIIGEAAGMMMLPAVILWFLSLFLRTAPAFWIPSVIICLAWSYFTYLGKKTVGLDAEAIGNTFIAVLGFIVASSIIAYRKRWKS